MCEPKPKLLHTFAFEKPICVGFHLRSVIFRVFNYFIYTIFHAWVQNVSVIFRESLKSLKTNTSHCKIRKNVLNLGFSTFYLQPSINSPGTGGSRSRRRWR